MSENMLGLTKDVRGTLNDLLEKLGGENGREWLIAFKRFLRKENPWEVVRREFKAWRTVKLGTHKSTELLREALQAAKFRIDDRVADFLRKIALSQTEVEIELVRVTVGELGFEKGATRKVIYERALESGLSLCPAEVGPQLRLQYADLPEDEMLIFAMEPALGSSRKSFVLCMYNNFYGRQLNTQVGLPDILWPAEKVWVFASRE